MTTLKMQPIERGQIDPEKGVEIEFGQIAVVQDGATAVLAIQGDVGGGGMAESQDLGGAQIDAPLCQFLLNLAAITSLLER